MSDLLTVHRAALARWREAMNLVGPGPLDPHYADSDAALAVFATPPRGRWADLGTGAGFPGIVFAARFPDVAVDLVDSRRKRTVFLEQVVLGADRRPAPLVVRCARVEELDAGAYDGLMSRAFAPPPEVFAHAARLLKPAGELLFLLLADQPCDAPAGFVQVAEHPYAHPDGARRAVLFRRT